MFSVRAYRPVRRLTSWSTPYRAREVTPALCAAPKGREPLVTGPPERHAPAATPPTPLTRPVPATATTRDEKTKPQSLSGTRSILSVSLRDYQKECISHCLQALHAGETKLAVSLPTGSGKTVIFTNLIKAAVSKQRALILVHRKELALQTAKACHEALPQATVGLEMAESRAGAGSDVVIASVASLSRDARLRSFDPKEFGLIVIDECHHAVALTYQKVLDHFGLVPYVGFSATLERADQKTLQTVFPKIVYEKSLADFVLDKWLSDTLFTTVETEADLSAIEIQRTGDYNTSKLSLAMNTNTNNALVLTTYNHMVTIYKRKATLVFCINREHLKELLHRFQSAGIDARAVTGDTKPSDRLATVEAFKAGVFPVLLNCEVFTEGVDLPNIDCVLLVRPTRSRPLLTQMIGRGLRTAEGKDNCHIVDFVGLNNADTQTVPALLGLKPSTKLKGMSLSEVLALQQTQNYIDYPKRFLEDLRQSLGGVVRVEPLAKQSGAREAPAVTRTAEGQSETAERFATLEPIGRDKRAEAVKEAPSRPASSVSASTPRARPSAGAPSQTIQRFHDYLAIGHELDKEALRYPEILLLPLDPALSQYPWLTLDESISVVGLVPHNRVLEHRLLLLGTRQTSEGVVLSLYCIDPQNNRAAVITTKKLASEAFSFAENYLNLVSDNNTHWRRHTLERFDPVSPQRAVFLTHRFMAALEERHIEGALKQTLTEAFATLTAGDFIDLAAAFFLEPYRTMAYTMRLFGWKFAVDSGRRKRRTAPRLTGL